MNPRHHPLKPQAHACALLVLLGCASPTTSPTPPISHVTLATPTPPAPQASLEQLVSLATRQHPVLAAQHARWRAQVSQTQATRRWSNPTLGYVFAPLPIETRLGPNRHTLSIHQKIPWLSHTSRATRVGRAHARTLAKTFDARYITVRLELEQLYWSLWSVTQERRIRERERSLLESLEASVRVRVEIGRRPASELSRLGLERSRLNEDLARLDAQRQILEARLGRALGLPRPFRPVFSPTLALTHTPPRVDLETFVSQAPAPPHLQALSEEIARRRAQQDLADLDHMPSFEIGAQWALIDEDEAHAVHTDDPGRDAVMMRVGVSVPIWASATHAKVDAAQARVVEARALLQQARHSWLEALRTTYTRLWDAHRRIRRIETTLLIQARTTHDLVRADYEADRAEFSALLHSARGIYALELEATRERAARERHVSRWRALLGHPSDLDPKVTP